MKNMKKRLFLMCAALAALVLEILPYGAVLNFANPEGEPWRRTYSYFDPTPFGYANFAPFIVAILTCALIIITALALILKRPFRTTLVAISVSAALLSFCPLLLGADYISPVGVLISVMLTVCAVLTVIKDKE